MNKEFNKTVFFDNIAYLIRSQGMKIGELEMKAGVSPGYISRTTKEANTKPGIDFIVKASEALNIGIDTLIMADLASKTPTERYILKFLDKLIRDTSCNELFWDVESADYLNYRLKLDEHGNCSHPLFSLQEWSPIGPSGYPEPTDRILFYSEEFKTDTMIAGNCYHLRMPDGTLLYVMNLKLITYSKKTPERDAIEIWICPKGKTPQFLCSDTSEDIDISCDVDMLYKAIEENAKHPKLAQEVRSAIDAFMDTANEDSEEEDTFPCVDCPYSDMDDPYDADFEADVLMGK